MNIPYLLFKKVTNNFSDDRIIGKGGFGNVYKGELDNGELIAVKMLHPLQGLDEGRFKNEVCNNLFKDGHPNIIRLLGYCDETRSELVEHLGENVFSKHVYRGLCFDYFPSGSLHKHLFDQSLTPNWSTRYSIIKGICEGLCFLHGCKPAIYHLDLKPDNILLDSFMVPKLADFGMSRLFVQSRTHVTQRTTGTDKYMPPEYRIGGTISSKNDVYSLGIVMIEIMEGYSLFQEMEVAQFKHEVLTKWHDMIEPTSEHRAAKLCQVEMCIAIAMDCVDSDRNNRPPIARILHTLNMTETGMPKTQPAVLPPCWTINVRDSLDKTVKMLRAELDNITNPVPIKEQVHDTRVASSHVEYPLITGSTQNRETSSYVEEGLIIGRTEERKKILSILSESSTKEMVILPIYGIGGIGKTTLAQLVYNDTQFNGFSRVWVYVSEKFDLKKIGNSIISLLTNETSNIDIMEMLNNKLANELAGKSILIVLDDLWENDPAELDKLKAMLKLGQGSKVILVTTRDEQIARFICSTVNNVPYKLDILTDDMCWTIIKQKTKFESQADKRNLEQIGIDIAIKCGGVALAAQSIGYLLMSRCTSDQWESVRKSDIWYSEDASLGTHKVLASLRLSYSHMSRWLKSCFSYCGVFKKGHNIAKHDLIHQWIALGFPEPSEVFDPMQICEQYVIQLLGMSFLQYSNTQLDYLRRKEFHTHFTMHDLVHDLARATLADKVNKNENVAGSSCQYALLTDPSMPLESSLNSPENLKALHFLNCRRIKFSEGAISPAKCLLVLDLRGCGILELPDSIGQLKQLRYLYVQCSMIPDCITKLSNLNYLSLRHSQIKALPDSIGDMRGLMHLDLYQCSRIRELPVSFAELKQLVHLNLSFCIALEGNVFPEVIGKLAKLRYLMISDCGRSNIQSLLVAVSTLHNLEHLDMSESNEIVHIPECFGNLKKLQTLDLTECYGITELPSWMNKMVSLKIVDMTHYVLKMSKLECSSNLVLFEAIYPFDLEISELENVMSLEEAQSIELIVKRSVSHLKLEWTVDCDTKYVDDKDVLEKLVARKNIRTLHVAGYRSLSFPTNWQMGIEQYLPNVCKLTLENLPKCNNLSPLGQLPNLWELHLHRMDSLEELNTADSCGELIFPKLGSLHISSCPGLRVKPCLPRAVSSLSIEASDNMLISLAESVRQTSASPISLLSELDVCKCTVPLHQWEFLQHVSALRKLIIRDCSDIASFSSPEVIQRLFSLESLVLVDSVLAELPTWLGQLTFLPRLTIRLPKLEKLNDDIRKLTRLESLTLSECRSMRLLPQWLGELTSLQCLDITGCDGITSLPSSMRQLTELSCLMFDEFYVLRDHHIKIMFLSIPADADKIDIRKYIDPEYLNEEDAECTNSEEDAECADSEEDTEEHEEYIPKTEKAKTFLGTTRNLDTASADAETVGDTNVVALVPSLSALSIKSSSATGNMSDLPADAVSHSTQENVVHKRRAGVRRTWTRRPRQLCSGASSSGSMVDNSAAHALIRPDEVDSKVFVTPFSAISIESATKILSDPPADLVSTSTHDNVAHKHDVGVMHTSTHEIRQPRQLLPAASSATTNSLDTPSGSKINEGVVDALITTDKVDAKDLVSSFSKISIDSGFTFSSSKRPSDSPADAVKTTTHENVTHKRRGGARHTWTRQPRQLAVAASAATTNCLDTPSGSMVNNNCTAADAPIIPTNVVADVTDTSVEDIIRSFFALSNEPDSATWLDM